MSADAEAIKLASNYLGGTIGEELANERDDFDHDAELLLKFHGIYQQDDRDVRRARTQLKLPLDYSCMVRASVPGGVITNDQWLALDRVAALADHKLRLTTRQGVQYHVVHKGELRELVGGINSSLLTTLGACGDVVRNVMACPLPHPERSAVLDPLLAQIVARFRPQTESYWELWVDGERAVSAEKPGAAAPIDDVEPIYGAVYLPRKFKIAIAWPGDNCVDIYTNDVGIVPTLSEGTSGELTGFVVLAGGGMGMSHSRPDDTYPLLAQPVAWVPPADVVDVVEAIVTTQRDHGNREDRSRARLKYLLEAQGIDWLRDQIEQRTGLTLAEPVALPDWEVHAHHGWHDIAGSSALGLPVPSGKVAGGLRLALRRLVADSTVRELRVTSRQDLLLLGVRDRVAVENVLRSNGVRLADDQSPTRNLAIACPALPTCSEGAGRGRAGAARRRRPAREGARRHRQHRAAVAAEHDRVPQRVLAAVRRGVGHRRAHQEELRRLRRWLAGRRPTRTTAARRRPAHRGPRAPAPTARVLLPIRAPVMTARASVTGPSPRTGSTSNRFSPPPPPAAGAPRDVAHPTFA